MHNEYPDWEMQLSWKQVQKANLTMTAKNKTFPHSNAHLWTVTFPCVFEKENKEQSKFILLE